LAKIVDQREAGLGAFEDQHLEQAPIVIARDAPLLVVVVADVERVARPGAPPYASSLSALPRARLVGGRPAYDLTWSRCR